MNLQKVIKLFFLGNFLFQLIFSSVSHEVGCCGFFKSLFSKSEKKNNNLIKEDFIEESGDIYSNHSNENINVDNLINVKDPVLSECSVNLLNGLEDRLARECVVASASVTPEEKSILFHHFFPLQPGAEEDNGRNLFHAVANSRWD